MEADWFLDSFFKLLTSTFKCNRNINPDIEFNYPCMDSKLDGSGPKRSAHPPKVHLFVSLIRRIKHINAAKFLIKLLSLTSFSLFCNDDQNPPMNIPGKRPTLDD